MTQKKLSKINEKATKLATNVHKYCTTGMQIAKWLKCLMYLATKLAPEKTEHKKGQNLLRQQ